MGTFSMADVPDSIKDAVSLAKRLEQKPQRTYDEEESLHQARLRVAFWACRREGIIASWDNLRFVLGAHAAAIQPAYDRMMAEREATEKREAERRRDKSGGDFWGGAERLDEKRK